MTAGELDGLLSGFLRRRRREVALPYVQAACRILDVGCGVCLWAEDLKPDQTYLGIDVEPALIRKNKEQFGIDGAVLDLSKDSVEALPRDFDLIIALAVLEHFPDPVLVLQKLSGLLSPDGKIVLTTPAPSGERILEAGAKIGLFAQDKHQHYDLLGHQALRDCAGQAGLTLESFRRFLVFQNQFAVLTPPSR